MTTDSMRQRFYRLTAELLDNTFNAQPLLITDQPVSLEAEPNDLRDKAQAITLPAVVAGRFDAPRDADWFEFTRAWFTCGRTKD